MVLGKICRLQKSLEQRSLGPEHWKIKMIWTKGADFGTRRSLIPKVSLGDIWLGNGTGCQCDIRRIHCPVTSGFAHSDNPYV